MENKEDKIVCSNCGSPQIHAYLAGNIKLICLKCGNKFKPGEKGLKTQSDIKWIEDNKKLIATKAKDAEKTQLYKCDCGKESSLFISHLICPKCGRQQKEENIYKPTYEKNKGCFGMLIIFLFMISTMLILS